MISRTVERGMTLVELCAVCVMVGMISAVVWPAAATFSRRIGSQMEKNDLRQRIHEARFEALRKNKTLVIDLAGLKYHKASAHTLHFFPDGTVSSLEFVVTRPGLSDRFSLESTGRLLEGDGHAQS